MASQENASSAMFLKEVNFTRNLKLIKKLVTKKTIGNFEKIEKNVQALFCQLDSDNRKTAEKVFQHLIRSFQSFIPPGNLPLFHELAKLHKDSNSKEEDGSDCDERVQGDLDVLLQDYFNLCNKMKCDPKKALHEDLIKNGNLGQNIAQMDLSTEEYRELCEQLLGDLK